MKTPHRSFTALACTLALSGIALGSDAGFFHQKDGLDIGYWDDEASWWTSDSYSSHASLPIGYWARQKDVGTLILRTSVSLTGYFTPGAIGGWAVFVIEDGGRIKCNKALEAGEWANTKAVVDIRPGGVAELGGFVLGYAAGSEVICTNAGCFYSEACEPVLGRVAGSSGIWVQNGGSNTWHYAKDITVGKDGSGEIIVNHFGDPGRTDFQQIYYVSAGEGRGKSNGDLRVGDGTSGAGRGRIVLNEGARLTTGIVYLGGGKEDSTYGQGELVLNGGTFYSVSAMGRDYGVDTMWIGAAANGSGPVRAGTHGEIRGWGTITGGSKDALYQNSIYARLGNGAIVADGQGVERTLNCATMRQVTNVLFVAESARTNGWEAINKGEVIFPVVNDGLIFNNDNHWGLYNATNCIGCDIFLEKPDLLNAVRVKARRGFMQKSFYTVAKLQAADRSDVHADALPVDCSPLGFWRAGTFDSLSTFDTTTRWDFATAEIEFRYDHRKIQKSGSRIVVLRWNGSAARWDRVAMYLSQPEDFIVSSGTLDTTSTGEGEAWSLGLFCVAERPYFGTSVFIR